MKRVGYILKDKKAKRLGFETDIHDYLREHGVQLIRIDLSRSLEEQGPFDVIIHKTSDLVVKADFGSAQAQNELQLLSNYIRSHPAMPVMDRMEKVVALLNRTNVYQLVKECQFGSDDRIFTPNFAEFTTADVETNKKLLEYAQVDYPIVVKHTLAQSADIAHQMALVFNEEGLKDITPPCVAQTFINHDASLHKIYVLGEECFVVDRPSIKNLYQGDQKTIFFSSQTISKPNSSCSLNQLDINDIKEQKKFSPDHVLFRRVARTLREKLELDLIGIDVIIDNQTGRYAIIDINSFPGYEGVPDFAKVLTSQLFCVMDNSNSLTTLNGHLQKPASGPTITSKHKTAVCSHCDSRKSAAKSEHFLNGNAWASDCRYCCQAV